MDLFPLIPENVRNHDTHHCILEFFQGRTCINIFPSNVALNFHSNFVDTDSTLVQCHARQTLQYNARSDQIAQEIANVEETLIRNHAQGLIATSLLPPSLKRRNIYRELSGKAVEMFGLLQDADFLPSRIEQYLDFTLNPPLHTCKPPCPRYPGAHCEVPLRNTGDTSTEEGVPETVLIFQADQNPVIFYNYQLGHVYRKRIKLMNVTSSSQSITLCPVSKTSAFDVKMVTESSRIAPGMSAEFLVTFRPDLYEHHYELLSFIVPGAQSLLLEVYSARDAPKLRCFVVNASMLVSDVQKPKPGSQFFSERRRSALNMTIECGSCLLGNYNVMSVVMRNDGEKGEFFITTEQEWFFAELNGSETRDVELLQGCFSLFPVHFELQRGEVGEFFIIFAPNHFGLYSEKLVVLCDNNAHQEIELVGDCIAFQYDFLKVDLFLSEEHVLNNKTHLMFSLNTRQSSTFLVAVHNKSPIPFEYYWGITKDVTKDHDIYFMDPDWLEIKNCTKSLAGNSETDFAVKITANTDNFGEFYTRISLYLKNVPIPSMANYDQFVVRKLDNRTTRAHCDCPQCAKSLESTITLSENDSSSSSDSSDADRLWKSSTLATADVHICQLMITCSVRVSEKVVVVPKEDIMFTKKCICKKQRAKVTMSKTCLNFGLLPPGVEVSQQVTVINLTPDEDVEWHLLECQVEPDMTILIDCPMVDHLNHHRGLVKRNRKRQTVTYRFTTNKEMRRWISVLILLSTTPRSRNLYVDFCCLVIYEIVDNLVSITTDTSPHLPLICPKQILYPSIPVMHTVYFKNFGFLPTCFCLLKPCGRDKDKIRLKYEMHCGTINAGSEIAVRVELTALEAGILDDFKVPCFTGDLDTLQALNVVCVVVGISVYFYLPRDGKFMKILWPPDTNVDLNWPLTRQELAEGVTMGEDFHEASNVELTLEPKLNESIKSLIDLNSVATTYPTVKVLNIPIKTPTKMTFFIENRTPVVANFNVEALNYGPREPCLNQWMVKTKIKSARDFWEKACLDGFGIVVDSEPSSGDLIEYEVKEVNLWIYANTWGRYLEEVNVEIDDLTPFCFNLYMEVIGLPLEFPFAVNTICKEPVFRLGCLNYYVGCSKRTIKVTNISAIPVYVTFHIFDSTKAKAMNWAGFNFIMDLDYELEARFVLTDECYGAELCPYVELEPTAALINQQETVDLVLSLDHTGIVEESDREKVDVHCSLIGFVHLQNEFQFKENYFKRTSGMKLSPLKLSITGQVEIPSLTFDFTVDDTKAHLFVNDVLLGDVKHLDFCLVCKNVDESTLYFSTFTDPPFKLVNIKKCDVCVKGDVELKRNECVQIALKCVFTHEELLKVSENIYNESDGTPRKHLNNLKSSVTRNLFLKQGGFIRQVVPLQVVLHFPQIEISPPFIKFGACLLYNTKKTILSIYNLTGSKVRFEIYKSLKTDDFEVKPNHEELARNTGANKQFVDVNVYFTPRQCRKYTEIIRIMTNIPQYYIDVPVIGYGSNNEKFHSV